jgi:Skp family chaperone for outer membrane proteins
LIAAVVAIAAVPLDANPGPSGVPRVAVINIQSAVSNTREGHEAIIKVEKNFESKKNDLKTKSNELDALKRQYESQGPKMNEEARSGLTMQINGKQRALARLQEDYQADYSDQQSQIAHRVLKKLVPIIDQYAQENHLDLVIDNSKPWPEWPIVWVGNASEITKAVVEIYDSETNSASAPLTTPPQKDSDKSPK